MSIAERLRLTRTASVGPAPGGAAASALATVAAVSVWFSLGITAVTGDDTRLRVIELPSLWVLPAALVAAVAITQYVKPPAARLWPLLLTVLLWLPYVPGAVPAVFLVFEGPIEVGLWVMVGLAIICSSPAGPKPRAQHPGLAPISAAIIAAAAYALGAVALRDQLPIGDEPHYLMMTQSLIKDGDLRIENNHRNRDYASFATFDLPMHYLTRGTDGEIYSVHSPGVSLVVLPAFALFGYSGGVATVALCVAIASAIAWHAAWLLTAQIAAAWLTWAAVFLTAPIYLQAITVFPDAVGALPVTAGVWLLIALEKRRPVGDGTLVAIALALACLPWLHSRFAILAGGLGLAIALRLLSSGWRRVATFLAVPMMSAALWFGFFWWVWGSPSPAAPWGGGIVSKAEWIPRGIRGLLLDPQGGLLVPAPAYLIAIAGWFVLLRSKPRFAVETAIIGAALAASVAAYETWWGGRGAPARYLVAALPLGTAPIAWLAAQSRRLARLGTLLVGVSLLMLMARVYAAGGAFAFIPEIGRNPVFGWLSPSAPVSSLRLTPTASQLAFVQRSGGTAAADRITLEIPADGAVSPAARAIPLGDVRVFFMDRVASAEPTGFWVPASLETRVIMDRADPARGLGVRLQSGPVPTSADVTVDGQTQRFEFTPRQRREMEIPPSAAGAWTITIRAGAGFKPRDYDSRSTDSRNLGIWIEVF